VAPIAVVGLALADMAHAVGLYVGEHATNSMSTAGAGDAASALDAGTLILHPVGMTRLEGHQVWGRFTPEIRFIEFDKADSAVNANGGNGGNLVPLLGGGYAQESTVQVSLGMAVFSVSGTSLATGDNWTGQNELTRLNLLTLGTNPDVAVKITER
jgi:long-subunit fatty acid transport protein